MQRNMNRDDCLLECISTIRSDTSEDIRSQLGQIIPSLTEALGATYESINGQFEGLKRDIIHAIKEQNDSVLKEKDQKIDDL